MAPSSATGTPAPASLPTPATTPTPMISYPDLSGSLTIQPKYPVHFADSASEDDSYAIYSPTTSFAYFASDQPSSSAPLDDDSSHDHNSNNSDSIQLDRRRRRNFLLRHQHQQRSADLHLSFAVSSSAHHERIIGLFWEVFLPNSRPLPTKTLGITLGGAVGAIGSYDLKGDALKKGLLAMAMTTVGKKQLQRLDGGPGSKDAERLRMEGIRLYGKALQQMSQTLKKGSKWTTEHWVTTRLFNLYEVCQPLFYSSWLLSLVPYPDKPADQNRCRHYTEQTCKTTSPTVPAGRFTAKATSPSSRPSLPRHTSPTRHTPSSQQAVTTSSYSPSSTANAAS